MRVEADRVDGDLMYFTCPACRRHIYDPFSRYSGPVPYRHTGGGGRSICRLIVIPSPTTDAAEIEEVPAEEPMEGRLQEAMDATLLDQIRASFARVMSAVEGDEA